MSDMKRRTFITLLGGAAAAWPIAARAQQPAMPVIGFLSSLGRYDRPYPTEAFRRGLRETAFVEGSNLAIEYRFAENQGDRLPSLAADLVGRKVGLIAATGGGRSILAAKASTTTIPIVFTFGGDPVHEGFVVSLNRPGGNHEIVPNAAKIGLLVNPKSPESSSTVIDAQDAARTLGRQLLILNASTPSEIDTAFASLRRERAEALFLVDAFFTARRQQIVALAARDGIPAMYANREFVTEGGLMSYGNDIPDAYRRAGIYAGRILKGEKPADLPVDQATKFEIVINLKTAKALGLTIPETFLARADEVIE
jgi:ABC-type uncharacterized transport system substrate-binding protein